jgi:hypothetical protein
MVVSMQFCPLNIANWLYLYSVIALLIALAALRPHHETGGEGFRSFTRLLLVTGALLTMTIAGMYLAQDALLAATGRRLARGDLIGARETYKLVRRFPFTIDYIWCSQQMVSLAKSLSSPQRETALALARDASEAGEQSGEQKFSALYQSAVLAIITNDFGQAEVKLRGAVEAAPRWYRPRMMLASVLWLTGRSREAEEQGHLAREYAGSQEQQVSLALRRTMVQRSITPQ